MTPATGGALASDLARLEDAAKSLFEKWAAVREQWRDGNAEAVEEQFLAPLAQVVGIVTPAIGQLSDELTRTVRVCGEPDRNEFL